MSTTKVRDLSPRLQDRYGHKRTPRSVIALTAILAIVIVVFGGSTAWRHANPPVRYKLLAWDGGASDHTDITFEVRRAAGQPVECALRVQNHLHHDLGYALVHIPAGEAYVQQTYPLATISQAFAAEVLECGVPGNLHVPQADFPPGTSNPPQPWRP